MNRQKQREWEIQRQRERQQNNDMMTEGVVLMSLWPRAINILISNWSRRRKFSQSFKNTSREDRGFHFSHHSHALMTLYDSPIFMLWLVKIWQVSSCRKFRQHLENCLLWQLKLTEFFVILWYFFTVFFHWMRKMKYSCYQQSSVIHGWFVYWIFWLRNAPVVKVGNPISDDIVFVLLDAGWKVPQAILALLDRFQELHLEW